MQLIKLTVSQDAAISRQIAQERVNILFKGITLNGNKTPSDAIRAALTHKMLPWQSFDRILNIAGDKLACKLRSFSPANQKRGSIDTTLFIHELRPCGKLQAVRLGHIRYTIEKGYEYAWTETPDNLPYQHVIDSLMLPHLLTYGQNTLFSADVRRGFAQLTDENLYKIWTGGVYVCLTQEDYERVLDAASVFDNLESGALCIQTLDLSSNIANRETIAHSLASEFFIPAYTALRARAEKVYSPLQPITEANTLLLDRLLYAENALGVTLGAECEQARMECLYTIVKAADI